MTFNLYIFSDPRVIRLLQFLHVQVKEYFSLSFYLFLVFIFLVNRYLSYFYFGSFLKLYFLVANLQSIFVTVLYIFMSM